MSSNKAFGKPTAVGKMRLCDVHGCGSFGADRGSRKHMGEDYVTAPGEPVYSPICGKIIRVAYPYADNLSYKGVEIKNSTHEVKIFYMTLTVPLGSTVTLGQQIGVAQNIAAKYSPGMTNHVHVEVRNAARQLLKLSDLL
ncbi:MAG TPA: M23 family metallopeptidase [Flavobacterium sp.]